MVLLEDFFAVIPSWCIRGSKPWEWLAQLPVFFSGVEWKIRSNVENAALINAEHIYIGENCTIEPFVTIKGPVYIGNGVVIRSGAYIREYTVILDHAVVGHASEISCSVMMEGSRAAHFNYVGNSVVGREVNMGSHAVLANVRLDKKPVDVVINGKRIETGLEKLGSILGDSSTVGASVLLNPGTIVAPGTGVLPEGRVLV
ncbi:MAG: hypothetical protein A3F09_01755 [Chlamydiae bacterium RIFCSPHIGHO2_12_FULL_49_11]|nr:MAG: hypothetical protein A3F09_01755 [Chlamydiae bacterium RIFCSPHIGHO2_12_FULL_49_11]